MQALKIEYSAQESAISQIRFIKIASTCKQIA